MITSEKSGNNYFPASSEFSHIVSELERYIETPDESSLKFDFKVTSILTKKTVELAYWAYSYSRNCITIKLLNKDLKVYNNFFGINSEDNFILLDDIKLFALTMNRFEKFNLYGFVEQEICKYILNKIKNKPKELILSTSTVKSKLRSNYLSLKQIQESGLSQSRLDKLETEIVHYLSNFLLQQKAECEIYQHHILPLKIADIKLVFPWFEERLAKFLANSNKRFDYNIFRKLKTTYQLSDDFLKLYLDELLKSSKRRTYYAIVTKEAYKFVLNLLWNSNGVALKRLGLHSPHNIVLMDDIQLFSLSDTMLKKLTSDNFDNVEICHYLLEKVNVRLKNILSSSAEMSYRLKCNYISLKQIQNGDLSQSDLDKLETEIVEYLSKIFVIDPVRLRFTPEMIVPLKIADLKTVFPNFEERLVDKIASSILGVNVNNCKNLKTNYNLSDDFLKLCLRNYSNKITSKEQLN